MNKKDVIKVFGLLNTKKKTKDLFMENADDEEKLNSKEDNKAWKNLKSKK